MVTPISNDLRKRILKDADDGNTRAVTADRFEVASSTVTNLVSLRAQTGSHEPRPRGGDKRSGRIEELGSVILALVDQQPDITLAEIAEELEANHGERFGITTIWRFFKRRKITFKKNRTRKRTGTP